MFYDDEPEELPWDYFLTDYERDLLALTLEEALTKYSRVSKAQVMADLDYLRRSTQCLT